MTGPVKRKCNGGVWDGAKPTCMGLNQENDYASKQYNVNYFSVVSFAFDRFC